MTLLVRTRVIGFTFEKHNENLLPVCSLKSKLGRYTICYMIIQFFQRFYLFCSYDWQVLYNIIRVPLRSSFEVITGGRISRTCYSYFRQQEAKYELIIDCSKMKCSYTNGRAGKELFLEL